MSSFWEQRPALLYALCFLCGVAAYLFWEFPCNVLFPLFWSFYLIFLRKFPPLLLIAAGFLYTAHFSPHVAETQMVSGIFSISSVQPHATPFTQGFLYKGSLHFSKTALPCSIFYRGNARPLANCNYFIHGTLQQKTPYNYTLKVQNWQPIPNTYSLAEMRLQAKESLRHFLSKNISSPRTASFLSSLLTGEGQDRLLRYEFARLGLQHILAISGFHFAILIAFSSFFLNFFLPRASTLLFLMITATLYFLFIGPNPAVQRSWIAVMLYLLAKFLKRQTNGLNLLGTALLFEVIADPLITAHLGFQLSFLSCAGILLFFSPIEEQLFSLLPKRAPLEIAALTPLARLGHLLATFLRKALALTASVNVFLLPLLLYHFHTFPLLSLFYNLFFPFLVGLALFLLLISCVFHFLLPFLGALLFTFTNWFTTHLLDLTSSPPLLLDYRLSASWIPAWSIPIYLFGLFAIAWKKKDVSLDFASNKG